LPPLNLYTDPTGNYVSTSGVNISKATRPTLETNQLPSKGIRELSVGVKQPEH